MRQRDTTPRSLPGRPGGQRAVNSEPSLTALRIFRASAHHLSFTKAARELHVTQAAVSHQIAALESYLGLPLFRRSGRGVVLTAEGDSYLVAVREALAHLEQAALRLQAARDQARVTCSIATTVAMRWLVPNLRTFNRLHPNIEIRLSLTERYIDFDRENVDVAIRYGNGEWAGLVADLLFREELIPVCSPDLLGERGRLERADELLAYPLLHTSGNPRDWRAWLSAHQVRRANDRSGPIFEQPHLAYQAAADGLGVAMADRWLVRADIKAGRLVTAVDGVLRRDEGYYLVGRKATRDSAHAGAFWQWLLRLANESNRV